MKRIFCDDCDALIELNYAEFSYLMDEENTRVGVVIKTRSTGGSFSVAPDLCSSCVLKRVTLALSPTQPTVSDSTVSPLTQLDARVLTNASDV